ncbi:MAG: hypothetical protein V4547_01960 [Bacteroidota bacterium]
MKIRNVVLAILIIGGNVNAFCQTKMIAHKSHSGKNNTFSPNSNSSGNFGNYYYVRTDSVVKISDKAIVTFISDYDTGTRVAGKKDTVYGDYSKISIDRLRALYPLPIKLVGFEEAEVRKK